MYNLRISQKTTKTSHFKVAQQKGNKKMFGQKIRPVDQEVFALYDSKAQCYNMPMFAMNQLVLLRELQGLLQDPGQSKNQLVTNPQDFHLFRIGTYEKKTGLIIGQVPEHIYDLHVIVAEIESRKGPTFPQAL